MNQAKRSEKEWRSPEGLRGKGWMGGVSMESYNLTYCRQQIFDSSGFSAKANARIKTTTTTTTTKQKQITMTTMMV